MRAIQTLEHRNTRGTGSRSSAWPDAGGPSSAEFSELSNRPSAWSIAPRSGPKAKKESIPARYLKVKQRVAIVEWAMEHGIKPASERFGLDRKTIREWRDRYRAKGLVALVLGVPEAEARSAASRGCPKVVALIEQTRRELQYGVARTRIWLRRVHKKNVPMATIFRTFVRIGLPYLVRGRKRAPRPPAAENSSRSRLRPGGRESRQARWPEGLPVHVHRRPHPLPRAAPVPRSRIRTLASVSSGPEVGRVSKQIEQKFYRLGCRGWAKMWRLR